MSFEKALGLFRRFEPPHPSFPFAGRLMRVFDNLNANNKNEFARRSVSLA